MVTPLQYTTSQTLYKLLVPFTIVLNQKPVQFLVTVFYRIQQPVPNEIILAAMSYMKNFMQDIRMLVTYWSVENPR